MKPACEIKNPKKLNDNVDCIFDTLKSISCFQNIMEHSLRTIKDEIKSMRRENDFLFKELQGRVKRDGRNNNKRN